MASVPGWNATVWLVPVVQLTAREREEKLNVKKLEDYFQEVLPKLQSNFFISLIEGRVREEDYERFLLDYQVDMKGPLDLCFAVLSFIPRKMMCRMG